jgi:hypothetical protein
VRTLADLIDHLWTSLDSPHAAQVNRLYLETCLLAVPDPQRRRDAPARLRKPWRLPLQADLGAFGVPAQQVEALADSSSTPSTDSHSTS